MITTLSDIRASDRGVVGGKAWNCARLRQAGFPVPDGLVIVADGGSGAAADAGREPALDPRDAERLENHPWLAAFPPGQRFAVRSSAVDEDSAGHSFAGVHETILNVQRADLVVSVRACIGSIASPQAQAYRASRGLPAASSTGVLIQPMVPAFASGVAFTVDPVSGEDEVIIEAVRGLGDDLVSGRVPPDRLRVRKSDRVVLEEAFAGFHPVLTADRIAALVALALQVEAHYAAAQDIEWTFAGDGVWLLQSRPVTTSTAPAAGVPLPDPPLAPPPPPPLAPPVAELPSARPDVEWTRANLAEVMPDQMSPQALALYVALMNTSQRRFAGGLLAAEETDGPPFAVIGGRMYFNLTQLTRMSQIAGAPPAVAKRSLGHAEGITPDDERHTPVPVWTLLRLLPDFVRLFWLDLRSGALVRQLDAANAAAAARLSNPEPATLDDGAIWQRIKEWMDDGPRQMTIVFVLGGVSMIEEQLRRICRRVGEDYDAFVYPHLAAGEASVSTQQAFDLLDLVEIARSEPDVAAYLMTRPPAAIDHRDDLAGTRFASAFERFLERYGHRGLYESDYALPRYREDPSPLLFAIQTHLRIPPPAEPPVARDRQREAAAAWTRFEARQSWLQRLTLGRRARSLLAGIKTRYVRREYCRSELIKVLEHARRLHLVLAARFADRGWIDCLDDYFMLLAPEIEARLNGTLDPDSLRPIVAARRHRLAVEQTLKMPLYLRQRDIPAALAGRPSAEPLPAVAGDESQLRGTCVSRGVIEGQVVVIRDPREFSLMQPGAILVAPATDPSWTPLFTLAAGVIVEIGGVLSHASTVAREYGLPALANVKDATRRLRTGEWVRLDASGGVVERRRAGAAG